VNASNTGMAEVVEDIAGNENETSVTAEEINAITGVSGAREGVDYTQSLAEGTYGENTAPTVGEIQVIIDAENANVDGMSAVKEDILGNADDKPATATQINAIKGVSGAREGVDYAMVLNNGTYVDIENPTVAEIQAVISAYNRELDEKAAKADTASRGELSAPVAVSVLDNDNEDYLDHTTLQITGTESPGESLVVKGEGTWSIEDGKILFTPEVEFVFDPTPISYSLENNEGERLSNAQVEVNYAGFVREDKVITSDLKEPVVIDVLKNDNGDLNVSSVQIVVPEGFMDEHEGVVFEKSAVAYGKKLVVPTEGTWSVNLNGTITYVAEVNVTVEPTPIAYRVFDKTENKYLNEGNITIKKSVVAGENDTSCQTSDSIPVFTKIGLGILAGLGSIFGLFFFRREKK
jgi:hypothetical protein